MAGAPCSSDLLSLRLFLGAAEGPPAVCPSAGDACLTTPSKSPPEGHGSAKQSLLPTHSSPGGSDRQVRMSPWPARRHRCSSAHGPGDCFPSRLQKNHLSAGLRSKLTLDKKAGRSAVTSLLPEPSEGRDNQPYCYGRNLERSGEGQSSPPCSYCCVLEVMASDAWGITENSIIMFHI